MDEYLKKIKQFEAENKRLKQENARLKEKLSVTLDGTGLCLWEQHVPSGSLTIFNVEWGKMLGYQANELSATVDMWKSKLHPEDYDFTVRAFEDHINGKTDFYQVVHRMIHKDGTDSWVSDRGRVVEYDDNGLPLRMMGTHIDITQEKRYEIQLATLANSDPLTGLLNRKAMLESYQNHLATHSDSGSALIFIDVDNFKAVNDELGHKAGDDLLLEIATWLKNNAMENCRIGRLGGDEFVILCSYSHRTELMKLCHRLLSFSAVSLQHSQATLTLGFSIGICLFTGNQHRFEDVCQRADSAMYQVKKNGKNSIAVVNIDDDCATLCHAAR
ncbi:diguanylate cyclase [Vibrio tapetis subsp. quintayensis]|uniref:diguanylate cyclase domain-containing protein n=1 Tax=Vibrio tapetis TaxID=52443 RepID=UPI0025B49037|nr:diguanylate cyclase [Vibrio tapetis]MDN3681224.1 diguanylate cyclase [Vibrio tapetis subsp. quintayensis]